MIERLDLEGFSRGLKEILEENLTVEMAESVAEKLLATTHPNGTPLSTVDQWQVVQFLREGESRPLGKQLKKWLIESRFCLRFAPWLYRWYLKDMSNFDMLWAIDIIDTAVDLAQWRASKENAGDSDGYVMHSYNQGFFDMMEVAQKVGTAPRSPSSDREDIESKEECVK